MPHQSVEALESMLDGHRMTPLVLLENVALDDQLHRLRLDATGHALGTSYTRAGQYAVLGLAGHAGRYFALASPLGALPVVEFWVARGSATSDALCGARAGDTLLCSAALGAGFLAPHDDERPVVIFASGTGLAAVRPLVEERLRSGRWTELLWSRPGTMHVGLASVWDGWRDRGLRCWATEGGQGHFVQDIYSATDAHPDPRTSLFVLCGSDPMQQAVQSMLQARWGVGPEQLRYNH
jgi:NAD(P)H-flavin reductase